jgi:hypothetical protein
MLGLTVPDKLLVAARGGAHLNTQLNF